MTAFPDRSLGAVAKRFLWFMARVLRLLAIVIVLWIVVGNVIVWALPQAMMLLTVVAMIWYFVRSGEGVRFSLRTLFVFMTGIAIIIATATQVPWLGGGGMPLWPVESWSFDIKQKSIIEVEPDELEEGSERNEGMKNGLPVFEKAT